MNTIWNTRSGRLFFGGCGTQIGAIFTCGSLTAIALICSVCALFNILSISLTQEFAELSENAVVEAAVSEEAELQSEIAFLRSELELLQANPPSAPAPPQAPALAPKPLAIAVKTNANLRSGPSTDYKKVGSLPVGGSLEIVGRNLDSSWWLVSTSGGLAWVSDMVVTTSYVDESNVPMITIPALLVQPAASGGSAQPTPEPPAAATPSSAVPVGTPTPGAEVSRQFAEDTSSYKRLAAHLLIPPMSASFSPDGEQIAITERIKLYTVNTKDALTTVWLEDDDMMGPIGNVVWSPDGKYIAFLVGYKEKYCEICKGVGLLDVEEGSISLLEHPGNLDLDSPRWTQDGRLLVNAHPGESADGVTYIYDTSGQGQVAAGEYVVSASHYGQRWHPWLPGKSWRVDEVPRADSYNAD